MPEAILVHDNFTGPTGMGFVVGNHARWLLDAGWDLTLVGDNVPLGLAAASRVVHVPPKRQLPSLIQHLDWCRRVHHVLMGLNADIVHVHSPLLAAGADLVTSHHLALPAYLHGTREGEGSTVRRLQAIVNRLLDDQAYQHLPSHTFMSFVSEFLRDEFQARYGAPRGGWILSPPAPGWHPPTAEEVSEAHLRFGAGDPGDPRLRLGYLGGRDQRKGWPHLTALAEDSGISLLMAGPGSEELEIGGRRGFGFVDADEFLAGCDVVLAPAVFDAAPVALLQAVARDVPVVTTAQCGWAPAIDRHGAGVVWDRSEPLAAAVRRAVTDGDADSRRRFVQAFGQKTQMDRLLSVYRTILEQRTRC